jgi:hypothetical protein
MSDFFVWIPIGIMIGFAIGINVGIILGKQQKPWSELTEKEKKFKKLLIGVMSVILIIGVIVFLWEYYQI